MQILDEIIKRTPDHARILKEYGIFLKFSFRFFFACG
jgi:hypothetical protein